MRDAANSNAAAEGPSVAPIEGQLRATLDAETIGLPAAAQELGLTLQGLWRVIEDGDVEVLRRRQRGNTQSVLTRVDFERIRSACAEAGRGSAGAESGPPARPEDGSSPLLSKLQDGRRRVQELESECAALRERLVSTALQVGEAHGRLLQLRERYEGELHAATRSLAAQSVELEQLRAREQGLREDLAAERDAREAEQAGLRRQRDELRRRLHVAREIELATEAYIRRIEAGPDGERRPA